MKLGVIKEKNDLKKQYSRKLDTKMVGYPDQPDMRCIRLPFVWSSLSLGPGFWADPHSAARRPTAPAVPAITEMFTCMRYETGFSYMWIKQ